MRKLTTADAFHLLYGGGARAGEQFYFRAGDREFFWLWETEEDIPPRYTGSTRADAYEKARATGLPVSLWGRIRMNDYVGPPNWGEVRCYGEVEA